MGVKVVNTADLVKKQTVSNSELSKKFSKESNNCSVRALMSATSSSYKQANDFLEKAIDRKVGKGVPTYAWTNLLESSDSILGHTFTPIGEGETIIPSRLGNSLKIQSPITVYKNKGKRVERQMTLKTFLERYPEGTFLVNLNRHVLTVKDGVIYGNLHDAVKLRVRIETVFKVEEV